MEENISLMMTANNAGLCCCQRFGVDKLADGAGEKIALLVACYRRLNRK